MNRASVNRASIKKSATGLLAKLLAPVLLLALALASLLGPVGFGPSGFGPSGFGLSGLDPAWAQSVAPTTITIEGRGWGHGNGLGQWGALGYAIDHGWTSAQIVDHFYSNTTSGTVSDRDIRVHLTRNDRRDLLITSGAAFSVNSYDFSPGEVARLRVVGNNRFDIFRTSGCRSTGSQVADNIKGQSSSSGDSYIEAFPANTNYSLDDVSRMLEVIYCDAQDPKVEALRIAYRGVIGLLEQTSGYAFNRVPLEQYLRSVVPSEMPPHWGALGDGRGLQAMEAQAIAARSWTLVTAEDRVRRGFFTEACDSTRCQVYSGASVDNTPRDFGTRVIHSNTAVLNTVGIVRVNTDGSYAFTEYSSSSGGYTAGLDDGSNFPAALDEGDDYVDNPNHVWRTTIRRVDVEAAFPSIGQLRGIDVIERNGLGPWGGRVRGLRLHGTAGTKTLSFTRWANDIFRKTFALRSDWYRFPQFGEGSGFEIATVEPGQEPEAVAKEPTVAGEGLWVAKADGAVLAFGQAQHHGDAEDIELDSPIVGIAAHRSGRGYWLVSADGEVRAYGEAQHHGSAEDQNCLKPVVAIAANPADDGYWLADENGGIYGFGGAQTVGNGENLEMFRPVSSLVASSTGDGYWLADAGGGIYNFGDASAHGSTRGQHLPAPAAGLASDPTDSGYWLLGSDSAIYQYGSSEQLGSRHDLINRRPAVALAATKSGDGYWIVWDDGTSFPYGDAPDYKTSSAGPGVVAVAALPR